MSIWDRDKHHEHHQLARFREALDHLLKETDCMSVEQLEKAVAANTDATAAVVARLSSGSVDPGTEAAIVKATTQIETNTAAATAALSPHPARPVYEHHGEGAIDATQWPTAPFKTTAGVQLYFFVSDVDGGQPTAPASSEWSVYTGEVVAA